MNRHDLLLSYYGDDFTGSTDVLEALTLGGVPAVLFLKPPTVDDLRRFPECRAVGVAGMSRSRSPEWMTEHLPGIFAALGELGAPLCHYKVCSTFDSSPTRGSIGRAVELGRQVFGTSCVPLVVGAPVLKRFVVFGNLFAASGGENVRIDRHPTMSRHPVTPMDEADLRRHLARQSNLACSLVDLLALQCGRGMDSYVEARRAGAGMALFDTLDAASLLETGKTIWESRGTPPCFVAGSSGVEYSLLAWWAVKGMLPPGPAIVDAGPVDRLLVVSGSCSPGTGRQIRWAMENGFEGVAVDARRLIAGDEELARVLRAAGQALAAGQSPVVYTAAGPVDLVAGSDAGGLIGERLGQLASELVRHYGIRRVLIAGGDTSGHVGHELGIEALTMVRPFAPGSPLCRIWSREAAVDGIQILMKGGQVGADTLFGEVRSGKPAASPAN